MKLLKNKTDNTKVAIIAVGKDDAEVLQFLYDNHICFGFYQLSHYVSELPNSEQPTKLLGELRDTGLDVQAIAFINEVKGFVPEYPKKEVPTKDEKRQQSLLKLMEDL